MTDPIRIACTLTGERFMERIASIHELARDALQRFERRDLVLTLSYHIAAAARVRAIVRQEQECCSFLTFAMHEDAGALHVTITAPEEARAAADFLLEQFAAREPATSEAIACCRAQGACSP